MYSSTKASSQGGRAATSVAMFNLFFVIMYSVQQIGVLHLVVGTAVLEGQCNDMLKETWHKLLWVQGCQSRRTGSLGLSADTASPGLQALVRLYYSTPQHLGYVFPTLPSSFQLLDGRVVYPGGRLVPFPPSSGVSSRAADVFRGSVEEMPVVLKTSARINEEVSNPPSVWYMDLHMQSCVTALYCKCHHALNHA